MNKSKKFDCVLLKNKIQEQLYKKINPKSTDEYFSKISTYVKSTDLWKSLKQNRKFLNKV